MIYKSDRVRRGRGMAGVAGKTERKQPERGLSSKEKIWKSSARIQPYALLNGSTHITLRTETNKNRK